MESALRRITAELTVAVVDSDRLFTPADGAVVAQAPACRELVTIASPYGHDAFLIETPQVFGLIDRALRSSSSAPRPPGTDPSATRTPPTDLETRHAPAAQDTAASRAARATARSLRASGLW